MWRLARSLRDKTIYVGKRIMFAGSIRNTVKSIYVRSSLSGHGASRSATSAWVSSRTRPIFRSESSRFLLMVQMAAELWEFEEDGELMYHKCVDGYLPQLFEKWRVTGARHLVTIVLFARVYKDKENVLFEEHEKPYDDYFKTVVDNTASSDWAGTLLQLKREFLKIQKEILVRHHPSTPTTDGSQSSEIDFVSGTLSNASQGNILEAISLASQQYANSYFDPDLLRTGLSIIVITPGTGVFQVEKSLLERLTEDLMRLGVGIDLVCLGRMPLHSVPLFAYREGSREDEIPPNVLTALRDRDSRGSRSTSFSTDSNPLFSTWTYSLPHWLDVSYWEHSNDIKRGKRQWRQRCRMHELQMMGVMEQEMSSFSIPLLTVKDSSPEGMDEYDREAFGRPKKGEAEMMVYSGRRFSKFSPPPNRSEIRASTLELAQQPETPKAEKRNDPSRLHGLFVGRRKDSDPSRWRGEASTATSAAPISNDSGPGSSITTTSTRPDGTIHTITRGFEVKRSPPQSTSKALPASPRTTNVAPHHIMSPKASAALPPTVTTTPPTPRTRRSSTIAKEEAAQPFVLKPPTSSPPWQIIPNPSNPKTTITEDSSQYRRWQHVTPRPTSVSHMKWKSMRTPAALPLQSAFFPKEEELRDEYEQYTYTVSVNPEETNLALQSLMEEMIAQRLAQGYQIVIRQGQGEGNAPIPSASAAFQMDFVAPQITKGVLDGPLADLPDVVYTTLGGKQIHKLEYQDQNISVSRYVRRTADTTTDQQPIQYECEMWGNFQDAYRTVRIPLQHSFIRDSINWNYMDALLSGWETQFKDSVPYRRGRWILIPAEVKKLEPGLDKEETHVAGIQKLNEMFQRGKWKSPDEPATKRKDLTIPDIVFCTESVAGYIAKEVESLVDFKDHAESRILQIGRERFNKGIKLSTLAEEMQASPPAGVDRATRRWHLKYYDDCFIGTHFVTWLVTNFEDLRSREEAVAYGEELMSKGLFEHCKGAHQFMDGHYFYRVSPQYTQPTYSREERKSWLGTVMNRTSPVVGPSLPPTSSTQIIGRTRGDSSASQTLPPPLQQRRQRVVLSSCLKLDVDPRKESDRPETVLLHYDRIHNPAACYHIRIEWLTATTRLVYQLLQTISSTAWRYGLRLVEAPLDEISNVTYMNPFREPLEIFLAVTPPPSTEQFFYHQELLAKKFDFVVDTEAAHLFPSATVDVLQSWGAKPNYTLTQYVHRSGLAFVQVTSKGSFMWLTNRMYVSRSETAVVAPPQGIDADKLRTEFKQFCADEQKLERWFVEEVEFVPNRRGSVIGIPSHEESKRK